MYNPFSGVRVTGTWEDHASYSAGGTDLPLGYGTVLPAPASGILRISGGSGEWACGWVGSAGRRSILTLDTPVYRHTPRRSRPFEAEGPLVAIVYQHQSAFGRAGWHPEGSAIGWSGASASGSDWGGDVHLHWHGLDASGNRLRIDSFLPTGLAGSGYSSINNIEPVTGGFLMALSDDQQADLAAQTKAIYGVISKGSDSFKPFGIKVTDPKTGGKKFALITGSAMVPLWYTESANALAAKFGDFVEIGSEWDWQELEFAYGLRPARPTQASVDAA
jgi:hypothetical protein